MKSSMDIFNLKGKTAVITGGGGVLCSAIAQGLGSAGADIALCDIVMDKANDISKQLNDNGINTRAYEMDVLKKDSIQACCEEIYKDFKHVDIFVNGAGGNIKGATTSEDLSFFDLPLEDLRKAIDLNLFGGAILPSQVFGKEMKDNKAGGSIINVSSMNSFRPLTRIPGYSAAKAAVNNFTMWLAVHLAQEYNKKLRVNAIAPGFFKTEQNKYLLFDEKTGKLTPRGDSIVQHTPMGGFGKPDDLVGIAVYLASEASRFVTGTVVPVDGGFSAFSGV